MLPLVKVGRREKSSMRLLGRHRRLASSARNAYSSVYLQGLVIIITKLDS